MKYLLTLILLLTTYSAYAASPYFSAVYSGAPVWGENLLTNPGLETGALGDWTGGESMTVVSDEVPHSGTYHAEQDVAVNTTGAHAYQTFSVSEGEEYVFDGYLKDSETSQQILIRLNVQGNSSGDDFYSSYATSTSYVYVQIKFTIPAGTTSMNVGTNIEHGPVGTSNLGYFDDMVLRKKL